MNLNRRQALLRSGALMVSAWGVTGASFAAESPAVAALDKSELIYLTPLLTDGKESKCHGEVWFVHHNEEIFVVTKSDAWRTEAIRRGLSRAAIWVGEFGSWKRAKDKYRSAPYLTIEGQLEEDAATHQEVLAQFGTKYVDEWGSWGPRFQDGLADGSRVMLRYKVVA